MNKAKNVREVLLAARWMLKHVGWQRGEFASFDPVSGRPVAFCAIGALMRVEKENPEDYSRALSELFLHIGCRIPTWNDTPGRTKEEVLAAFDQAIERISK